MHHDSMRRTLLCLALATCTGLVAACGSSPHATATAPRNTAPVGPGHAAPDEIAAEYLPGLSAHLRFPIADEPAPLIVLVPGGGWSSADPTGLIPLARLLTDAGSTTSLITYSTTGDGSTFPEAVDDVACAVRWSARPSPVPTAAHRPASSSSGTRPAVTWPHSSRTPARSSDATARTHPSTSMDSSASPASTTPNRSEHSCPRGWASVRQSSRRHGSEPIPSSGYVAGVDAPTGLRALLLHGDEDVSVPLTQTTALREALNTAGIEVDSIVLPGLDHLEIFEASHAGPPILVVDGRVADALGAAPSTSDGGGCPTHLAPTSTRHTSPAGIARPSSTGGMANGPRRPRRCLADLPGDHSACAKVTRSG